ncbi:hypothetical protein ACLB2K_065405 [Fragaria x ananassa]
MVNHGVATEFTKGMKSSAKKFFELPLEEKNKIAMPPNDIQGYGHSHADQILDLSDKLVLVVYPQQYRKLDVWPPSPFREANDTCSSELRRIGEELVRSISNNGDGEGCTPLLASRVGTTYIWSNGKYKSIEHRVVTNESKAIISYSTIYIPHRDVDIEPLDQMVLESPGSLPLFKNVTYGYYLKQTQEMKKQGKAHVHEVAKIAS